MSKAYTAENAAFAKRLQHFMAEKGWNQADLAREASKHLANAEFRRDNISLYMRAIQMPGPTRLRALSRALGVKDADLVVEDKSDIAAPPFAIKPQDDGFVWLQINQAVPMDVALEIAAMLRPAGVPASPPADIVKLDPVKQPAKRKRNA